MSMLKPRRVLCEIFFQIRHACRDVTIGAPTVEPMSNDRAGYSLPGIDCKFLIFFEESLFLAVNYVYFKVP